MGNVFEAQNHNLVWNSNEAMEIRRSILDGDFSYCSRTLYPFITQDSLPKKSEVIELLMRKYIDTDSVFLKEAPTTFVMAHDRTCNLACPSCRPEVIAANQEQQDMLNKCKDTIILPLLKEMKGWCFMTSDGDPFASKHYRSILTSLDPSEYPNLKISILTNRLLLTPKMWTSIPHAAKFIYTVSVSIDAATPETYLKVRRPGNFDSLLPNLEFLGNLRRESTITQLNFNFVVQNENYLEMEQFVKLGLRIGVDKIHFQRILNLSSIPDEEFLRNDIADPRNAAYPDFMKMLENPIFDNDIVDLYTLIPSRSHFKDRFELSDKA